MLTINEYQIDLAVIAKGSQAKIVKAVHTTTKEVLAVKIYSIEYKRNLLCFENEARILHKLQKIPQIITTRSCFSHLKFGFLVMNMCKQDLLTAIMNANGFGETMSLFYFKQICNGIKSCHDMNIAHLDIKPENILLSDDQTVQICDFGNAYQFQNPSEEVTIGRRGTLEYCAPEMKQTGKFNPIKADIWSLGILLHVMTVGYFPHGRDSDSINKFHQGEIDISFISKQCSPLFVNLLAMILDINNRPSISTILCHPVFNQIETCHSPRRGTFIPKLSGIVRQKLRDTLN